MHADRVLRDVVAEVVGRAVNQARFHSAARRPERETARMMVAAKIVLLDFALGISRAAKLAAPDHQRVVEQPALLEVFDQGGAGLVGVLRLGLDASGQAPVMIPVAMTKLNEADAAFGQSPRQEAIVRVGRRARFRAVHLQHFFRLFRNVHQLRHAGLHAERQLIIFDVRGDGRIAERAELFAIQLLHRVNQLPPRFAAHARRIGNIDHRVALVAKLHALVVGGEEPVAPVVPLQRLAAAAAGEHHERRQVVVLAAQAIGQPRAHRWPAGLLIARAHERDRRIVIDRLGKHGPDERDVVHDAADVRQQAAQLDAGFAVAFEFVRRAHTTQHRLARRHARDALAHANAGRQFHPGHLLQLRLGIEQIQVRRRAGLKHVDDALGRGGMMKRLERAFGFQPASGFGAEQSRIEQR